MAASLPPVSRAGRALDVVALLLVIGGGVAWIVSYVGLERLRATEVAFARGMAIAQLAEYHRLETLSHWAFAGILAGVACGIASWWLERRRRRRAAPFPS